LSLANAMHQFNACKRDRGMPETFEAEHHVRSGPDVAVILFNEAIAGRDQEVARRRLSGHCAAGPG
jgi:hypothetical protein